MIELHTPLSVRRVRSLRAGDEVALSGTLYSMRDQASARVLRILMERGRLPVDLAGAVVFHAGPALDKTQRQPRLVSIGPTTSARMNLVMPKLIRLLRIRCVIGKGGMGDEVLKAMGETGCVYASGIGGCAALYTRAVKAVHRIVWEEMGPEALHELEVERFGPLIITMDAQGHSLHRELAKRTGKRLEKLLAHRRRILSPAGRAASEPAMAGGGSR